MLRNLNASFLSTAWEVQFEPARTLDDYQISKLHNYKDHIKNFFKFYAFFDYTQVMSTYSGELLDKNDYKLLYPNFLMEGILIVGPFNKGKNCGVVDERTKNHFIQLSEKSSDFLDDISL